MALLSTWYISMYGIYYLMFATFPGKSPCSIQKDRTKMTVYIDLFSNVYHFSAGVSGLCYIGLGLGFLSATIFGASFADRVYLTVSNNVYATRIRNECVHTSFPQEMAARESQNIAFLHSSSVHFSSRSAFCQFFYWFISCIYLTPTY